MRSLLYPILSLLALSLISSSCVSNKQYLVMRGREEQAEKDNMALHQHIQQLEDTVRLVENKLGVCDNANETALGVLSMTRDQMESQQKRLMQMQAALDQQKRATETLKMKIAGALVGFKADELSVALKNGRVYVSLQEALLFPSGSAKVSSRGKEALAKVASILTANEDININIEGHTDNVPIHTESYSDNWALSTARATSIAKVLIDDYSVSPLKLKATGRSYYDPIAINSTADGRRKNRRTEIILEPKYDELIQVLQPTVFK